MIIANKDSRQARAKIGDNRKSLKNGVVRIQKCADQAPAYLSMYQTPPGDDISLTEFDEIAVERLKLLKALENCKDSCKFNDDDFKKRFRNHYQKSNKLFVLTKETAGFPMESIAESWRRDVIGHFILRLAFCRTPENTKWLVNQEVDLFKFRFLNESQKISIDSMKGSNFSLEQMSEEEKMNLSNELSSGCGITHGQVVASDIWKVDFTDALDLVRRRQVLVKGGIAYVPYEDLVVILCGRLRNIMTAAMARSYKHLAILEEEGRLLPRLSRLANNAYDGKQYDGAGIEEDKITRHMIDQLSTKSFPPCMRQMHSHLRVNHHLKYGGRRQYGLFLKALGLSLDEAMMMMRDEFTKKITSDKFDKEYAYNIRYQYGKEGKRIPQTAMSCSAIILRNPPSSLDCHGCPFRHTEPQILAQRLQKENFTKDQVQKIVSLSEQHGYDKACTRFFEYSHKMEEGALGQLITHPNQYFDESQKVLTGKRPLEAIAAEVRVVRTAVKTEAPVKEQNNDDSDFEDI